MKRLTFTLLAFLFLLTPWCYLHFMVSMRDYSDGLIFVFNYIVACLGASYIYTHVAGEK